MSLLHWPRDTSSRKAQHDDRLPDYKFEEQNYDHILPSRPHEDDELTCEFIITRLELIRGKVEDRNIEVFQAWFRRREISDTGSISISSIVEDPVVCKVAYGSAVDSLKRRTSTTPNFENCKDHASPRSMDSSSALSQQMSRLLSW